TCIGLILKGYNVYENNQNRLYPDQKRVWTRPVKEEAVAEGQEESMENPIPVKGRKTLSDFMNSIKDGLIDLFKEEGDKHL
ncbi:MAG: cell division protein FtsA, partial [Bacteroidota bacterium]